MTATLDLERLRHAVADELEERGLGNKRFIQEIRAGCRDDAPYMIGAIAWAKQMELATSDAPH